MAQIQFLFYGRPCFTNKDYSLRLNKWLCYVTVKTGNKERLICTLIVTNIGWYQEVFDYCREVKVTTEKEVKIEAQLRSFRRGRFVW